MREIKALRDGGFWKALSGLAAVLAAAGIGGLIVMYGDLRVAKANDEAQAAKDAQQDEILAKIPDIAANAAAMAATVEILAADQKTFMSTVDAYIKADIERDASKHHTHSGGNP